jgi:hypothetical protein
VRRSHLTDVFENFLGADLTKANAVAIEELDSSQILDLADLLDQSLLADTYDFARVASTTLPISASGPFSGDMFADDFSPARLALIYQRVVVPIAGIREESLIYTDDNSSPTVTSEALKNLYTWTVDQAPLLRTGALFPVSTSVYMSRSVLKLCDSLAMRLDVSRFGKPSNYAPVIENIP